jgi:hypothetical protein
VFGEQLERTDTVENPNQPGHVRWWFPPGVAPEGMVRLSSLTDVETFLRQLPKSILRKLLVRVSSMQCNKAFIAGRIALNNDFLGTCESPPDRQKPVLYMYKACSNFN